MKPRQLIWGLAIVGFFCCCNLFADALDNWHWRNPLPNGNPQPGPHTLYGLAFANGEFVGVGDSGTASISYDGTNWTESTTATTSKLNAIAYLNGTFVAVGDGGAVESSADGTNWILGSSGVTNSLTAVTYGNGEYLAIGISNVIITSTDSLNWTPHFWGTNFSQVTYGSAGFLAVNGGSQVYLSSDGLTWTGETIYYGPFYNPGGVGPPLPMLHQIVTFQNGTYYVGGWRYVGSATIQPYIFTSTDRVNWTTNTTSQISTLYGFSHKFFILGGETPLAVSTSDTGGYVWEQWFNGSVWTNSFITSYPYATFPLAGSYGNGLFVLLASTTYSYTLPPIFTSYDGLNWVNQQHPPAPPVGPTDTFTSIACSNGVYVAASSGLFARSTDGLTYASVSNSPSLSSVIAYSNNFVGVGSGGQVYISGDGLTWTQKTPVTTYNLHCLAKGNGLLVAVGDNGVIQTSPVGTIWTIRSSGTSLPLYGVAFSNDTFVAVGQLGTVLTSPDGINWTGQDSGQLTNLLSVTYGSAGFLAVGPGGTILTSPDGVNWTKQNPGTQVSFESVSFGNGYYLAVGDNAVAMTSPDGVNWTARNLGVTGGQNLYGSAFLNDRFDVVGSGGTIVESDTIPPLFDLQIHTGSGQNQFTMFATPGSNFRLQACTDLSVSNWTDVNVFNNASAITFWTNSSAGYDQRFFRLKSP